MGQISIETAWETKEEAFAIRIIRDFEIAGFNQSAMLGTLEIAKIRIKSSPATEHNW